MRVGFIQALTEIAERDPRVLLLTGDLGYTVVERYAERLPERFFNVGVAEQNMIGLATGLAEAGFIPFVYSIATFATLRPYEQIRNGPVLQRLPVRIVGVGGGFEYGLAGPTHHGLEDIAVTRVQPGLTVIAPADHRQAASALRATWDLAGPIYYRLGKDDRTTIPGLDGAFRLGRADRLRAGADVTIVTMGAIAREALAAADRLAARGTRCGVVGVSTVSPPPFDDLAAVLSGAPIAVTVEAHYLVGGLGSLVAEVIAERRLGCRLVRLGVGADLDATTGGERYLVERHGLSGEAIARRVADLMAAEA